MEKTNAKKEHSSVSVLEVTEKWYMLIKKQPFICGLLFNFGIVILLLSLVGCIVLFPSEHGADSDIKRYVFIIAGILGVVLLLLLFFFLYRPLFNRRKYEIATDDERLIVRRNGKEIFNVLAQRLSFVSFSERPVLGVDSLKIDYVDDYKRTRFFYIPLRYIPNDKCRDIYQYVSAFINKYATNKKSAEEADYSTFFYKVVIMTIFVETLYFMADSEWKEDNLFFTGLALFFAGLFVFVGYKYFSQICKKK